MSFFKNKYAVAVSVLLTLQAVVYYSMALRAEHIPIMAPLASFPSTLPGWNMVTEAPLEPEIRDLLKADDTLNRIYASPERPNGVNLFIAYFKTQRYNQSPHSPKNCLPGNGYETVLDSKISFEVPVWNRSITANQFVVQHGEQRSVVLYWYQSHNRVVPSEYLARIWLVADAIRYHRSDTSIVRVVVPVKDNDVEAATQVGVQFVRALFPDLLKQLPA